MIIQYFKEEMRMKIYAVSDGKLKKSRTAGSQIFSIFNAMFLTLLAIICAFPVIHMFSVSLSSQSAVAANQVKLLPVGFNLASYHMVAKSISKTSYCWCCN